MLLPINIRIERKSYTDWTYAYTARVQEWGFEDKMLAIYEKESPRDLLPILIRELSAMLSNK